MTALMDTGFILALLAEDDIHHEACRAVVEPDTLVPSAVLPELAYMVLRDAGYEPLIRFLRSLVRNPSRLVTITADDLVRSTEIMEQYADTRIDFVDCMVAAMAERLNISRVLTVDQQHFRILRPKHVPAFEILP